MLKRVGIPGNAIMSHNVGEGASVIWRKFQGCEDMGEKIYKPWGYEEILINNGKYVIKKLFVKGKHRLSLQSHKVKLETLMIYGGKGIMVLGGRRFEYSIRDIRSLPNIVDISIPGTIHRVEAIKDTTIYEVSTPELDDVVRLEDDYGRA